MKSNKIMRSLFLSILWLVSGINLCLAITDSNQTNNVKTIQIDVEASRDFDIIFVPVDKKLGSYQENVVAYHSFIKSTYPVSDSGLSLGIKSRIFDSKNITNIQNTAQAKGLLKRLYKEGRLSGSTDRVVGVVPSGWFIEHGDPNTEGIAYFSPGHAIRAVIVEEAIGGYVAAHELGHTLGLCDEYSASVWNSQDTILGTCPNGDKNSSDGSLDSDCLDGITGCDLTTQRIVVPSANHSAGNITMNNFMGNSANETQRWIDVDSYNHLLLQFTRGLNIIQIHYAILIAGRISKNGSVELDPSYIIEETTFSNESTTGSYIIEIRNETGTFFNISFEPDFMLTGIDGNTTELNDTDFAFVLPYSFNVTQVIVRQNGTLKATKNISINSPIADLSTPQGGYIFRNPFVANWTASDGDNDTLLYAVLVSQDGGDNFSVYELDLNDKNITIDNRFFENSTKSVVKVLVTDGVNTNSTVSANFTIIPSSFIINNVTDLTPNVTSKVFESFVENDGNVILDNVTWMFDTGDGSVISSSKNMTLNVSEEAVLFIEEDYPDMTQRTTNTSTNTLYMHEEKTLVINPQVLAANVTNLSVVYSSGLVRVFELVFVNDATSSYAFNWSVNTGEAIINSTQSTTMEAGSVGRVLVEYTYTNPGDYTVIGTALTSANSDNATLAISVTVSPFEVKNLKNLTNTSSNVIEFFINNTGSSAITNVNWTVNNGQANISAKNLLNISVAESALVLVTHNYTSSGSFNVNATAYNASYTDSENITITIP